MFNDLSRHTLIRKKDGGLFLIKCCVTEYHGGTDVLCYLGLSFPNGVVGVDYETARCYTHDIDSIIQEI